MTYTEFMRRGFTLIELVAVVTIITILASVILASIGPSRMTARDSQRIVGLNQLKAALETYNAEYRAYPSTSGAWQDYETNGSNYVPGLVSSYLDRLPIDPSSGQNCPGIYYASLHTYWYKSDGTNYKVATCTEKSVPATSPFYDPGRPGAGFMICSGEPACTSW